MSPAKKDPTTSIIDMMKCVNDWGTGEVKSWALSAAKLSDPSACQFAQLCSNGKALCALARAMQSSSKCDASTFPPRFNHLSEQDREQLWVELLFFSPSASK